MNKKQFKPLSRTLVIRVLLFSSIFTAVLTSFSFYFDYSRRMNQMYSLFHKIEGSFAKSIAHSLYQFDEESVKKTAVGILTIPEISEIKILTREENIYLEMSKETKEGDFLKISEIISKNFFRNSIKREKVLYEAKNPVGTLTYMASLVTIYAQLLERLFIFFISQAAKTFAVSTFILLICRNLFTRQLSILSESIRKIHEQGTTNLFPPKKNNMSYTEIDILEDSISNFYQEARIKDKDQKILYSTSEKVLGMIRSQEISDFATELILSISGLDHCHFYMKEKSNLILCASRYKDLNSSPNRNILQSITSEEQRRYEQMQESDFSDKERMVSLPIHRGDSLFGIFLGIGMPEITDSMLNKKDFWLTLSRIFAMALIQSELYENLEKRVEDRTKEVTEKTQELEKAHAHIIQSEKMASLGKIVAGVAHELNTPIGAALTESTNLDFRVNTIFAKFSDNKLSKSNLNAFLEDTGDGLKNIVFSLTRAADIVRDFKQISVDQSTNNRREIELGEYLKQIMKTFESKISRKMVSLEYGKISDIVTMIEPGVVAQIMTNLTMNSLIHGFDNQGPGRLAIELIEEDDDILISFSDNGKGIEEADIAKIFDPFFTTKFGQGGSGLGLNVVFNLVNSKLHGSIECKSELGSGTTFFVRFPIERGKA